MTTTGQQANLTMLPDKWTLPTVLRTQTTAAGARGIPRFAVKLGLALAVFSYAPIPAKGQSTAAGMAAANVILPASVRVVADLEFGFVTSGPSGGAVIVEAGTGLTRVDGDTKLACSSEGICVLAHPAIFEVTGEANRSYMIDAPTAVSVAGEPSDAVSAAVPPPALRVDSFSFRTDSSPIAGPVGRLDAAGHDRFELGATLHVAVKVERTRYRIVIPVLVQYF